MSIKQEAHAIIDGLTDDAQWNDLIKALYRKQKITLGMTDLEIVQNELSESQISAIISRLQSASSTPDDMRNTKTYQPGNAATLGMVAGFIAVLFAFVFPPITWVAAPIAVIAGLVGIKKKEEKAWVAILLALVSVAPMFYVLSETFKFS